MPFIEQDLVREREVSALGLRLEEALGQRAHAEQRLATSEVESQTAL